MKVEGVNDRDGAQYYFGKRVAYIYKLKSANQHKAFKVTILSNTDCMG